MLKVLSYILCDLDPKVKVIGQKAGICDGVPSTSAQVLFNLICNMTTFSKRYSLTFWPHPLGQGCVCGQNICYHVAASVVSFNLICNMTTFRKIYSLTFWPHLLGWGCVCGQNICYHTAAGVVSFNLICNMTIFWKSIILASAPPPLNPPKGLGIRPSN